MKKTLNYYLMAVLGLILAIALTGCGTPSLDTIVKRFQKKLPQQTSEDVTITKCGVVGDYLEMEMVNDETKVALDSDDFAFVLEIMKVSMKQQFVSEVTVKRMLRACKDEGKGFRIVLVGEKSGLRVAMLEFTPEELQEDASI